MPRKKFFGLIDPLERDYVSELDRFLQDFDKNQMEAAYSESRYALEAKYERIVKLRDDSNASDEEKDIFEF